MKFTDLPSKDFMKRLIETAKAGPNPWGKRRLNRFKTVNGKRYQLHSTRGWKAC